MEPVCGLCLYGMTDLQPGHIKSELTAVSLSVSLLHLWVSADPITKHMWTAWSAGSDSTEVKRAKALWRRIT